MPVSSLRGERPLLTSVLLLAAGLRFVACTIWSEDLTRDPDAYRGHAERLVAGQGYVAPDGRPTAFRPPLYPLLLAGVLWAGPGGIAVLQVALGVGTVALTASLGHRLGLGRWSVFAAALVAADPLLLRYTPQVMTEATCAFLAVLVLWLAVSASVSSRFYLPLLLGVAFGLAVLSRPTFWAFGFLTAVVVVWGLIRGKRETSGDQGGRLRGMLGGLTPPAHQAAWVLLGTALVVAPWAIRNAVALGRPILTTTHGGYTLLLANNPVFWREVVAGPPGAVWEGGSLSAWQQSLEQQMAADHVPADEIARDRWMHGQAVAQIRAKPAMFLHSAVYRLGRFWSVTPTAAGGSPLLSKGAAVFYVGMYLLAGIGVVWIGRGFWRGTAAGSQVPPEAATSWGLVVLLISAFTAVHAVYWSDARMRAPLVPAVALLSANGLAGLAEGMLRRQKRAGT
jgi:hypothetical protein